MTPPHISAMRELLNVSINAESGQLSIIGLLAFGSQLLGG